MQPIAIPVPFIPRDRSDEAEWLERRRLGIGGSDVAAALGISKFKGPRELYYEKIGEAEPTPDNEFMLWGTINEDNIAREFARRMEFKVERRNQLFTHPDAPHRVANIDRHIVRPTDPVVLTRLKGLLPKHLHEKIDNGTLRMGLEVKTASAYTLRDWTDDDQGGIPLEYQAQAMWYLHVTGYDCWFMATLFGGNQLRVWLVIPDPDLIIRIVDKCDAFWDAVENRNPPEITGSDTDEDWLKDQHPNGLDTQPIEGDAKLEAIVADYHDASQQVKDWEEQKRLAANKLRDVMKDHTTLDLPCGKSVTWKNNKASMKVNTKAMIEAHPEIAEEFKEEKAGARVLRVPKLPKGDAK